MAAKTWPWRISTWVASNWRKHDYKQAADELEKYVKLEPKAPDAKKVRYTIKELRNKS